MLFLKDYYEFNEIYTAKDEKQQLNKLIPEHNNADYYNYYAKLVLIHLLECDWKISEDNISSVDNIIKQDTLKFYNLYRYRKSESNQIELKKPDDKKGRFFIDYKPDSEVIFEGPNVELYSWNFIPEKKMIYFDIYKQRIYYSIVKLSEEIMILKREYSEKI